MKILFLADNFPPERNAQASRVYERACYWQRWGHEVTVITCFPNFPEGKLYPGYKNKFREVTSLDHIRVVRTKTFIAPNAGTLLRIVDFLSYMVSAVLVGAFEEKPDLVVATSPQFFAAVAGWLLSLIHRVRFVMEVSDLWPDSIMAVGAMKRNVGLRYLEKVELLLYGKAKRIIALTASFKRNLVSRGVRAEKIDVVINGVDLIRYGPRDRDHLFGQMLGISPHHFVIGYIGTLGMAHGLDNVLEAAARVDNDNVRFLLVGPGAEREELISKARERGLCNVIFVEPQSKERIPFVWSLCDVALVHLRNAKLFETVIPSKIFEAMGMGLPILLAGPKGEATDIIEREGCGFVTAPGNPEQLAAAVCWLAEHPTELEAFAVRSQRAAASYTREQQAKASLLSLQRALEKKAGEYATSNAEVNVLERAVTVHMTEV